MILVITIFLQLSTTDWGIIAVAAAVIIYYVQDRLRLENRLTSIEAKIKNWQRFFDIVERIGLENIKLTKQKGTRKRGGGR